jgi:hypothetical protein
MPPYPMKAEAAETEDIGNKVEEKEKESKVEEKSDDKTRNTSA